MESRVRSAELTDGLSGAKANPSNRLRIAGQGQQQRYGFVSPAEFMKGLDGVKAEARIQLRIAGYC